MIKYRMKKSNLEKRLGDYDGFKMYFDHFMEKYLECKSD